MARHWERYMGGPVIMSRDRLHVTLNRKGVFQLNRNAYKLLNSPKAVVLFFEKTTSTIGISPAHEKLREAFPVNNKNEIYWTINAIPFCRHFGIRLDGTEAFAEPELDSEGILQLDLRTTRRVHSSRRTRKQRQEAASLAAAPQGT